MILNKWNFYWEGNFSKQNKYKWMRKKSLKIIDILTDDESEYEISEDNISKEIEYLIWMIDKAFWKIENRRNYKWRYHDNDNISNINELIILIEYIIKLLKEKWYNSIEIEQTIEKIKGEKEEIDKAINFTKSVVEKLTILNENENEKTNETTNEYALKYIWLNESDSRFLDDDYDLYEDDFWDFLERFKLIKNDVKPEELLFNLYYDLILDRLNIIIYNYLTQKEKYKKYSEVRVSWDIYTVYTNKTWDIITKNNNFVWGSFGNILDYTSIDKNILTFNNWVYYKVNKLLDGKMKYWVIRFWDEKSFNDNCFFDKVFWLVYINWKIYYEVKIWDKFWYIEYWKEEEWLENIRYDEVWEIKKDEKWYFYTAKRIYNNWNNFIERIYI